jgi:ubiquitin conjugation factor E4 A
MGAEEALAEAPDDFVDPISCAVMDDPVQLPTSGKVVDRATITRILLSKAADPFNRAPLTIDQVKDMPELKEKIRYFVTLDFVTTRKHFCLLD